LTAGLPAVTYRPIPGHGIANSEVLAEAGLAPWPKDEAGLVAAIRQQALRRGDPSHVVRSPDTASVVLALLAERAAPAVPGQDSRPA
jgi:processive 1,2-diacylglycerol beta-glucosyltransferase